MLIDYLNQNFLNCTEDKVKQKVDKHTVKYKGKSIMQQHIKNKPIKWTLKIWCRCTPKTGYLYEFDIYNGKKETPLFDIGESNVPQPTEKLNENFSLHTLWKFSTLLSQTRKPTQNSLYGIVAVQKDWKTLPEIDKGKMKALKEEIEERKIAVSWILV